MMKGDENLSSFDEISRESIPFSLVLGDDDSVVVFMFGVSFEDDGSRSFADVEEGDEVGDEGVAEFVVLCDEETRDEGGRNGKDQHVENGRMQGDEEQRRERKGQREEEGEEGSRRRNDSNEEVEISDLP